MDKDANRYIYGCVEKRHHILGKKFNFLSGLIRDKRQSTFPVYQFVICTRKYPCAYLRTIFLQTGNSHA